MITYVVKRIGLMIFVLLVVSVAVFSMMYLVPGDPAEIIAKERYGEEAKVETIEYVRRELGLNQPVYLQYLQWLVNVLHGDLGHSYRTDQPVLNEICTRLCKSGLASCLWS
jgi:peptide/nickel transport system permease protein